MNMDFKGRVLGIIPARGGSKGVPRKNIKILGGKPLIAYSIEVAQQSKLIDALIVSTDDLEIADVAKAYGARVPFIRPAELAEDDTLDLPVFQHALSWMKDHLAYSPEIIVHLRPTSPLRTVEHVDGAIQMLLKDPEADSVRTLSWPAQNPYKMWQKAKTYLEPLLRIGGESYNMPRQSLPPVYWQNGYVDVIRRDTIMNKQSMTGDKILGFLLDDTFPIDLDTSVGFKIAEVLLSEASSSNG